MLLKIQQHDHADNESHAPWRRTKLVEVKVKRVKYINPTESYAKAYGACIFGDYIAVVGWTEDNPYIALLRKSVGGVVEKWIDRLFEYVFQGFSQSRGT